MPRTAFAEALDFRPDELARFLDECWSNWRNGSPETDYILFSPTGKGTVYMIGKTDCDPGWLDVDGQVYYSAAWL